MDWALENQSMNGTVVYTIDDTTFESMSILRGSKEKHWDRAVRRRFDYLELTAFPGGVYVRDFKDDTYSSSKFEHSEQPDWGDRPAQNINIPLRWFLKTDEAEGRGKNSRVSARLTGDGRITLECTFRCPPPTPRPKRPGYSHYVKVEKSARGVGGEDVWINDMLKLHWYTLTEYFRNTRTSRTWNSTTVLGEFRSSTGPVKVMSHSLAWSGLIRREQTWLLESVQHLVAGRGPNLPFKESAPSIYTASNRSVARWEHYTLSFPSGASEAVLKTERSEDDWPLTRAQRRALLESGVCGFEHSELSVRSCPIFEYAGCQVICHYLQLPDQSSLIASFECESGLLTLNYCARSWESGCQDPARRIKYEIGPAQAVSLRSEFCEYLLSAGPISLKELEDGRWRGASPRFNEIDEPRANLASHEQIEFTLCTSDMTLKFEDCEYTDFSR